MNSIMFYRIHVPYCLHAFICQWIYRLFPCLGFEMFSSCFFCSFIMSIDVQKFFRFFFFPPTFLRFNWYIIWCNLRYKVVMFFFFKSSLSIFSFVNFAFIVIGKNLWLNPTFWKLSLFSPKNFVILALHFSLWYI